jgi:hypothetical protein
MLVASIYDTQTTLVATTDPEKTSEGVTSVKRCLLTGPQITKTRRTRGHTMQAPDTSEHDPAKVLKFSQICSW